LAVAAVEAVAVVAVVPVKGSVSLPGKQERSLLGRHENLAVQQETASHP
jgi:hypothetical protein